MTVYRLIRFIRFVVFAAATCGVAMVAISGPAAALEGKAGICTSSNNYCRGGGTTSSPRTSYPSRSYVPSGPTPQQREAERRREQRQRMNETNDKGIRHYGADEFELAIQAFREALALCTREKDCEVIRKSIEQTQSWIDHKKVEAERQRQHKQAKQAIDGMLDDLASQWGATPSVGSGETGGLGFMTSGDNAGTTGSLQFMGSGQPLFSKGTKDSAPPLAFGDPTRKLAGEPLKDSVAPVRKRQLAAADVNRLAARVKAKASAGKPNPRTEVFLDALEVGKGDWAKSYRYLQEVRKAYPDNLAIRDAKEFFEGLTSHLDEVSPLYWEELRKVLDDDMPSMVTGRKDAEKQPEIDYKTRALVERAYAQLGKGKENKVSDYQAAVRLFKEAQKRNPDHLGIRDSANFFEGVLYSKQMGLKTTAAQ